MWLGLNDSFMAVCQHRDDENILIVRARAAEHLKAFFKGHKVRILPTPNYDYQYRVLCPREVFEQIVSERIKAITYPSFKKSVKDHRLNKLYVDLGAFTSMPMMKDRCLQQQGGRGSEIYSVICYEYRSAVFFSFPALRL